METKRRPRVVAIIDPIEEDIKEFSRVYRLVRHIMLKPKPSSQGTLQFLIEGLQHAKERHTIHNRERDDCRIELYSKLMELDTEDPRMYLSIAHVLYKGEKERTIAICVKRVPKEPSQCLIA